MIDYFSQSGTEFGLYNASFSIQISSIPSGGGMLENVPKFLIKRGITIVYNDDDFCGQRCLALADAKNKDDFKNMKKLEKMWSKRAVLLSQELDVKGRMSFIDFDKWAILRKKQVIILSDLFQPIYESEVPFPEKVYIFYDAKIEHYHYISDINSATNDISRNHKFCTTCHKSFRNDRDSFAMHKCRDNTCYFCKKLFESKEKLDEHFKNASWKQCLNCNASCPNTECHEIHSKNCKGHKLKCLKCKKYVEKQHFIAHKCGEKHCDNCKIYHSDDNHRCFIQPIELKEAIVKETWSYDFEAGFDKDNIHYVNWCKAERLFSDEIFRCETIEEFVNFVLTKKNVTFIAHNGKAYDTWLIHKHLILHTNKRPNKLILAGNKIMYMKIKSIRFIDSLNHVAQALSTFPKTFGLSELKKGYFPYTFNTVENKDYIGGIPDIKYFNPDEMSDTIEKNKSKSPRTEFIEWYALQKDYLYNFKQELSDYCDSDVDILKRSMEIYITDGIALTGINPIDSPTIASYAMKVYRALFLEKDKICVLKKDEYEFSKKGFFGGRTEVFKLKTEISKEELERGEFIEYKDICSLYPTVQSFDMLPCGVPITEINPIVTDYKEYIQNHFGYIECDISPPNYLHIPLLAEKKDFKLVFDLVEKVNAVYTSVELLRAIDVGYTITKIHKSLTFDKSDNLFKGYVNKFLKIKVECSGYDGDDIDKYIQDWFLHTGIVLEKDKIKSNKGMKLLAKILLNSLWGKFGQKDDMPTTEYYTEPSKWFRLLEKHNKGELLIKSETMIDENTLYVQYINKEEKASSLNTTNLALAAFITSQARLRLYAELYQLDDRVIYCDTDSIIYKHHPEKHNIKEGNLLGQWESETKLPIIKVLAIAPKSYGYETTDGKVEVKCKGITLHYNNSKKYNMESLNSLITQEQKEIETTKMEFVKDNKKGTIKTKNVNKIISYKPELFKRTVNDDYTTTSRK
jgi:hypothetical protein